MKDTDIKKLIELTAELAATKAVEKLREELHACYKGNCKPLHDSFITHLAGHDYSTLKLGAVIFAASASTGAAMIAISKIF